MHQIPDFPHQRLMAIDRRLSSDAIVIETRLNHGALELSNRLLAVGDAILELIDPRPSRLFGARLLAGLRVGTLFLVVRDLRLRFPCSLYLPRTASALCGSRCSARMWHRSFEPAMRRT